MSLLVKVEHNIETGEIVEIPLTNQEIAELEKMREAQEKFNAEQNIALQKEQEAKAAAQSKLAALGLTTGDIKALGL